MPTPEEIMRDKTVTFTGGHNEIGQLKLLIQFVAIPGAIGGTAKATWEVIDPRLVESEVHGLTAIPAYGFLGAVSAVLALALVSDFIKKTYTKLVGLSIACGLIFPSVLSSSGQVIKLQTQLDQSNNQTISAAKTVADVSLTSTSVDTKIEGISQLVDLAIASDNPDVRAKILDILKTYEPRPNKEVNQQLLDAITKIESANSVHSK